MTSPLRKASPGSRIAPSPSTRTPRPAPHRRGRPRRRRRRAGASRCVGGAAAAGVAGPDRGQGRDDGRRPSLPLHASRWRVTCFVSLALSQPKPPHSGKVQAFGRVGPLPHPKRMMERELALREFLISSCIFSWKVGKKFEVCEVPTPARFLTIMLNNCSFYCGLVHSTRVHYTSTRLF